EHPMSVEAAFRLPQEVRDARLPPIARLAQIGDGEAIAGMLRDTNYVGALVKLKGYDDAYLFVARFIDPAVLEQIQRTESNIQEYANLEARRIGVQLAFALMYTVIALTVLLSAVGIGFSFAHRLGGPHKRALHAPGL